MLVFWYTVVQKRQLFLKHVAVCFVDIFSCKEEIVMAEKEMLVESSLYLFPLPQIERETITVRPTHQKDTTLEVPLLSQDKEAPFIPGNRQTIRAMRDIALEANEVVCIAIEFNQDLQFALEFFFYMNDVKVAFFDPDSQKYVMLNGAPRKARSQERGILQEFFPVVTFSGAAI